MIIFSLLSSSVSTLLVGLVDTLSAFYVLALVSGIFTDKGGPAYEAMTADLLPESKRAEGFGIIRVALNLAVAIGPLIGGLTSFGGVVSLNGLARAGDLRLFDALRGYFNEELSRPGVTLQVDRYSLPLGIQLVVSPRLDMWLQPCDFHSRRLSPGGMLELTAATPMVDPLAAFVVLDGKTAGWVSGHPSLGPAVALLLGVQLEL